MLKLNTAYELLFPEDWAIDAGVRALGFREEGGTDVVGEIPLIQESHPHDLLSAVCTIDASSTPYSASVMLKLQNVQSAQFRAIFARGGRLEFVYKEDAIRTLIVDTFGHLAYELPIAAPCPGVKLH